MCERDGRKYGGDYILKISRRVKKRKKEERDMKVLNAAESEPERESKR